MYASCRSQGRALASSHFALFSTFHHSDVRKRARARARDIYFPEKYFAKKMSLLYRNYISIFLADQFFLMYFDLKNVFRYFWLIAG
jgi:hypothetical protein